MTSSSIMWFRRDLRVRDHPALAGAADDAAVLPLFVLDPVLLAGAGPARVARLTQSLARLAESTDGALVLRRGDPAAVVPAVAAQVGAERVFVSGETTPYGRRRDRRVAQALGRAGRALVPVGTPYAVDPGTIRTGAGTAFRVFTPYGRAWRAHGWPEPIDRPAPLHWRSGVESEPLPEGEPPGPGGGEAAARRRWQRFLRERLADYDADRDRPDLDATSRMSEPLKYGEVHPRSLLADLAGTTRSPAAATESAEALIRQLCWREFYADVLWHHPASVWADLTPALSALAYDEPGEAFEAWAQGQTGYPIVDAGMRALAAQGWLHNRLRMITASFLVKDLHVWWVHGARHFLALLRDGDVANNSHGWQWVAGTGTDAAPYFRVLNPVGQAIKVDPDGDFVRRWVPQLAHLPGPAVHEPWNHPEGYAAGYPQRLVDHATERAEALRRRAAARQA